MKQILVVDDDPQMRAALKEAINRLGYDTIVAENGLDALSKLTKTPVSLVITDMKMPKMDGLSFLKEVRKTVGNLPVLVITGYGTIENAVETMREGAFDYLMKPFSFDKLTQTINAIIDRSKVDREIITADPKINKLLRLAANIAASDTTVLIYGESGTGKELFARYVYQLSHKRDNPFVAVNCAAIPDNLMESELFGFEKGAFTGASEKKLGKFELANGGTILLDEIGEMSLPLQAKLLRVLQEKEVDRVGGKQPIPIDVRVIATTNKDLYVESREGRFREDLYYRLNVFPLQIPSLKERPNDIKVLSEHFLKKFSNLLGKQLNGFTDEAIEFLERQPWRGNIRELENTIHRASLLAGGTEVDTDDFMLDEARPQAPAVTVQGGIKDMEKEMIFKTLEEVNGNKSKAAKILGVSVRTIRNKLNEYGKNIPD